MENEWKICIGVGISLIFFFAWILFYRREKFDTSLLGLITLGVFIVLVGVLQPDSIRLGDMELRQLKREARELNAEAKESIKLALEASAMLLWNSTRVGPNVRKNDAVVTSILTGLYKDRTREYMEFMMKKGLYALNVGEIEKIPDREFPKGVSSPLYDQYLKSNLISQ